MEGEMKSSWLLFLVTIMALLCFSACGSSNTRSAPMVSFTIGGTVTNLAGTDGGLVLQDNGDNDVSVSANGSFTFPAPVTGDGAYKVTVLTQPSSPAQTCGVTQGSGIATGDVTNVAVDCGHNEWTWENGPNGPAPPAAWGTQGTASPNNFPGERFGPVSWTDSAGNFWLFGGEGYDSAGNYGPLNDLWKYSAGEWTWMSGANVAYQTGVYGTRGIADPSNVPGARSSAVTWTDAAGNFWLFSGNAAPNDLWRYSAGEWTWMSGASVGGQAGVYGTQGIADPSNVPGAQRNVAVGWTDATGNFWLFGGLGLDSAGNGGDLNDLWKYSAGEWTWMSGANVVDQPGTYGTKGTAAPGNVPPARDSAVGWTDAAGNLWLFGGELPSQGIPPFLNDLWKYSAGEWTWMSGANVGNQNGVYGTKGTAARRNVPGARFGAVGWTDAAGNLWLFGGFGFASNDLWKYSAGEWTWMTGSNVGNQQAIYGTKGTAAPGDVPGSTEGALGWTDAAGNFWFFAGDDFWKYEP